MGDKTKKPKPAPCRCGMMPKVAVYPAISGIFSSAVAECQACFLAVRGHSVSQAVAMWNAAMEIGKPR